LDQNAGCALTNSYRRGNPGTTCCDSHLVISKSLFSGDIVLWEIFYIHAGFRYYRRLGDRFSSERQRVAIFRGSRFSGEAVILSISGVRHEGQDQAESKNSEQYFLQLFSPIFKNIQAENPGMP
jgi:hypothetical protein